MTTTATAALAELDQLAPNQQRAIEALARLTARGTVDARTDEIIAEAGIPQTTIWHALACLVESGHVIRSAHRYGSQRYRLADLDGSVYRDGWLPWPSEVDAARCPRCLGEVVRSPYGPLDVATARPGRYRRHLGVLCALGDAEQADRARYIAVELREGYPVGDARPHP